MILYNGQLKILYDMVCRKEHLRMKYEELLEQKIMLRIETAKLEKILIKEQDDVNKLECGSLAAFFYYVMGKMDEKLSKEKEEAYAAAVKYDAAKKELERVEAELEAKEKEMADLHGCDEEYEEVLALKKERMKTMNHEAMEKVFVFDQRMTYLDNQNRELDEAMEAGNLALDLTDQVSAELDNAKQWGTFDLFYGDMNTGKIKYSKLDEGQRLVEELQHQLRRYKTELSDVIADVDKDPSINGFLQFADAFFNNLFSEWTVLLKIEKSKKQVESTKEQILEIQKRLQGMKLEVLREKNELQGQLDQLIVQVNI